MTPPPSLERKTSIPCRGGRYGIRAGSRQQSLRRGRVIFRRGGSYSGIVVGAYGNHPRRQEGSWWVRTRREAHRGDSDRRPVSHPAEGAQRRISHGAPASVASVEPTARRAAYPPRNHSRLSKLL